MRSIRNLQSVKGKGSDGQVITDQDFRQIVSYVSDHYGIDLSQKRILVNGRLETYFLHSQYDSCAAFMQKVISDPHGEEAEQLINVLTTNHTYFMRETMHFEYMRQEVLPYLEKKEAASKDLRVWSAASSTGEEPYTLAMLMMDYFGLSHRQWNTQVLATDISTRVLEHAIKGVYLQEQIDPLPDKWKRHYFVSRHNGEYEVSQELKSQVIFRRFNLMDDFPWKKRFHVVFLRNVMIYFPEDVKYHLVNKIYDYMEPGGVLFIGTTESLDRDRIRFECIQASTYMKRK